MIREFTIGETTLCIGNYTPKQHEFEKSKKYVLLKRVQNNSQPDGYSYHDTGYHGHTIRECKEWAHANKARWM